MKRKLKRKISIDIKYVIKAGFLSLLAGFMSLSVYAQQGIKVSGSVTDNSGELLSAVSVSIRGTTQGVMTDDKGEYSITVPNDTTVLIFSSVGYETQEITVGKRRIIAITLREDALELGDVTIVAFGTQRKESVIGAITTIDPKELKVPSSNLTTALAGQMAGIIAYQRSGEPGKDDADFFVRGITTFGTNTNPLVLIDGIELTTTDLARLQPDDIASFSIMKDATATALYGARGANGVIFVTTKQGTEGPAKISFRLENSISAPTRNIEFADPVTFMKLANEAVLTRDPLGELLYSQEKIDNTLKPGSNPLFFPANDWRKMMFKDYAMNQRANLSVSGGGTVARYYVAGSFSKDNGILNVDKTANFNSNVDFKNYSLRANVNINVTKTTELAVRLSGNFDSYNGPLNGGTDVYKMVVRSNPVLFPAFFPKDEEHQYVNHIMFGNYNNAYRNPYAEMVKGYRDESRSQMLAQVEVKQNLKFITEGLSFRTMVNISRLASFDVKRNYEPFWYQIDNYDILSGEYLLTQTNTTGTEYLNYSEGAKTVQSTVYTESMLNYDRTFDKHSVSGLLVFMSREYLTANAGSLQLSLPSRNLGLSGRATYSYDSRYFAEFNFGYNGSERFDPKHRFGFFPSAGLAWVLSNEAFWEPIKPVVSNFKFRYSYGMVGNDNIGSSSDRFFYLSNVEMNDTGKRVVFGTDMNRGPQTSGNANGISILRYENPDITWEISTKQNFALELGLWNKVNIIAEYFTEYRKNILMPRSSIPTTMGLSSVMSANLGEASGKGIDVSMDYQQSWNKNFWTSARANFTYAVSKYEKFEEIDYKEPWRTNVGRSVRQLGSGGYIAERLFIDDAEAANSPSQNFGGLYGGGDIKYTDVNRDGQITAADIVPMGYPDVPEIVYGFGFSTGYKGIDLSFFFQGTARESFWISAAGTAPFQDQTQLLKVYADSHWSEENQDVYALWPRLSTALIPNNTSGSNWWMRNGSFIRLKQAEIGYSIPGKWKQKLNISNLRIYLSGTNLLLFSKFKLWDVEMAGDGLGYPIQRVFNIGLNLSFN
ncbi:MAG: TonB-dependent receptor [Prevotellaceae bacterium]|jgi:TonB-linked SusC/RagA family outer membrane protein|nr:TonB-dependent receptor [Prevotellaceae bacterium]